MWLNKAADVSCMYDFVYMINGNHVASMHHFQDIITQTLSDLDFQVLRSSKVKSHSAIWNYIYVQIWFHIGLHGQC